jgi:hypothetical protein
MIFDGEAKQIERSTLKLTTPVRPSCLPSGDDTQEVAEDSRRDSSRSSCRNGAGSGRRDGSRSRCRDGSSLGRGDRAINGSRYGSSKGRCSQRHAQYSCAKDGFEVFHVFSW